MNIIEESTIFTEPEENNGFSIITQTGDYQSMQLHFLPFYLFILQRHQEIARWPFLKLVLQYYNHLAWGVIARYDAILDQSERAHLHNHLTNYTALI